MEKGKSDIKIGNCVVAISTAPSEEEAVRIANTLLEKRLIACVNIVPKIRSIYRWKGRMCDEQEFLLIMKSRRSLFAKIKTTIKKLHSYECPELVCLNIEDGLPDYLKWIMENTK